MEESPSGKLGLDSWAFLIIMEEFQLANQIVAFLITATKLHNVLTVTATQTSIV